MSTQRDQRLAFYLEHLGDEPLPAAVLHQRLSRHLRAQRLIPVDLRVVQSDLKQLQKQLGPDMLVRIPRKALKQAPSVALANHRIFYCLRDAAEIYPLSTPLQHIGELELIALKAARDYFTAGHTATQHPLAGALQSLIDRLNIPAAQMPQSIGVSFAPRQAFSGKHLLALVRACRLGEGIYLRYQTPHSEVKDYNLIPVLVWFSDGEPYCWAWDSDAAMLKNFKVSRIHAISPADFSQQLPNDIHSEAVQLTRDSFRGIAGDGTRRRVVLRFRDGSIPYIRDRTYGHQQTIEELENGEVRIAFSTAGMGGIYRWILQFGSDAVVEEPTELAQWVNDEVLRMRKRYQKSPSRYAE